MKKALIGTLMGVIAWTAAPAQVEPAATGPGLPPILYKFNYTLSYSESEEFDSFLGNWQRDALSAQATYRNGKDRLPSSFDYRGGYAWVPIGPTYDAGFFQSLLLTQAFNSRKWNLDLGDAVSYLPESPVTGLPGFPEIGEPVTGSGPTEPSTQTILTLSTHTVDNWASANLGRHIDYATILLLGGDSSLLRYPDGNGLDTNRVTANVGLSRRLDARNTISGQYMYSQFSYPEYSLTFATEAWMFSDQHTWSRKCETTLSAGPELVRSSDRAVTPPSTLLTADASINYHERSNTAGLRYSRGVNGGAGFEFGARYDSVAATYSRRSTKATIFELTAAHLRTSGLQGIGAINAEIGAAKVTRQLGRYLAVFATYTAADQSSAASLPANTLNNLLQTMSFGIGYSPRGQHFAQ